MDTEELDRVAPYLEALRKAKTDNEKFSTLLMVAKVTKDGNCGTNIKREILEAVGKKFFSRLLKAKNVPDDCPPNIYKSVAMSILSAVCRDSDMSLSVVLGDNLTSFNGIILLNPSGEESSDIQLVDDTYECLSYLCQSSEGIESMIQSQSVSSLCQAIISQSYGCERAQDVLFCIVSSVGVRTWDGFEMVFNSVFTHYSEQFKEEKGEKKFELCKTLVFLLTSVPREVESLDKPVWIANVVSGLDSILRSKIGVNQREPALRLASMLVQVCGIESMLPPNTTDCKLFLLTTHLCCVEVRMVLEADDIKQTFQSGRLISSCYSYLECIINHLTTGPSLSLDDRQILQLHSAMMGAFGAVIHFLKRVSDDPGIQWNSIVLATIRILTAWMAEETTALKDEVCELIPFLIQVSKLCLPVTQAEIPEENCDKHKEVSDKKDCTTVIDKTDSKSDSCNTQSDHTYDITEDITESMTEPNISDQPDSKDEESVTKELENVNLLESDTKGSDESENKLPTDKDSTNLNSDEVLTQSDTGEKKHVTFETADIEPTDDCDSEVQSEINGNKSEQNIIQSKNQRDHEQVYDIKVLQNMAAEDKEVLSEQELMDLHLRVNIFHFLLPGLCHMTADDIPRQILLNCGALSLLDLYMWRQWEKFLKMPSNREVQSSIVILCNIFLNLTIVQPDAINKYDEFSHILLLTVKGIQVAELNYIVLWSHLITLGLMLIRLLHNRTEEFLESESIAVFLHSCIKYMNSTYYVKHKRKGQAVLNLAEPFVPVWDQISQTWFLSMQAFSACIPLLKETPAVVLQSGWLPTILKNLLEVRGNGVAEETRSCYLLLLISMAKESESAKQIIKEKKGVEISKMYKSKELLDVLQTPSPKKELTEN